MSAVQGVQYTVMFPAVDATSPATRLSSPTFSPGDAVQTKPGGTPTATTNTPTHLGGGRCQLVLTAAEMGLGLAAGEVGEFLLDIAHAGMVPLLGVTIEVQATAPGALTAAERTSSAGVTATAVGALAVDGSRTLAQGVCLAAAALVNEAETLPMSAAGGSSTILDAAGVDPRLTIVVDAAGNRTVTVVDATP